MTVFRVLLGAILLALLLARPISERSTRIGETVFSGGAVSSAGGIPE